MKYKSFDTGEVWTRDEIAEVFESESSLYEKYDSLDEYIEYLLDLGRQCIGGITPLDTDD